MPVKQPEAPGNDGLKASCQGETVACHCLVVNIHRTARDCFLSISPVIAGLYSWRLLKILGQRVQVYEHSFFCFCVASDPAVLNSNVCSRNTQRG